MRRCSASQASRSFRSRSAISAATASCWALTWASWLWMPGLAAWSSASSRVVSAMSLSTWAFLASASSRAAFSRASAASALALRSVISASTASRRAWELTLVAFCWVSLSIAEFWLRIAWSARSMRVRQASARVRAEEQREVGGHAAGLVGLGGDLSDQLPGVGDLLLVGLQLLGDLGLVLLREVHAGRQGLHFLDGTGHPALGIQERLLGAGQLPLVQDQVRRGLGDPGVHEFEGVLDPRRLVPKGGLLVLEVVGECHRGRGAHARRQDQRQGGADHAAAASGQAGACGRERAGPRGRADHRCHKHSLFVAQG